MLSLFFITLAALIMDAVLSELRRFHPLVGLGNWINRVEKFCYPDVAKANSLSRHDIARIRGLGLLGVILCCLPGLLVWQILDFLGAICPPLHMLVSVIVLYLCIGMKSLIEHANAIVQPLEESHNPSALDQARQAVAMIVSRDTSTLNSNEVAKAGIESVLENGADAVFSALFWFWLAGIPGVIIYRTLNTLDAMWGYKNRRYRHFGFCAARIDDLMNFIPARLTALAYACCGHFWSAMTCWKTQAREWKSPNAGPVMASGAGALRVILGGSAIYHGKEVYRSTLGTGSQANAVFLKKACWLVIKALVVWMSVFILLTLFAV